MAKRQRPMQASTIVHRLRAPPWTWRTQTAPSSQASPMAARWASRRLNLQVLGGTVGVKDPVGDEEAIPELQPVAVRDSTDERRE